MALAIRGTVLSTATIGSPLTYATVKVALDFGGEPEWTTYTNGSGQFKIELTSEDVERIFGGRHHRELVFTIYAVSSSGTSGGGGILLGCQTAFISRSTLRGTNSVNLTASPSYSLTSGYPNYAVGGYVVDADGTPRSGVDVIVYKKELRSETSLGTATTDSDGRFLVRYTGTAGGHDDGPEFSIRAATDDLTVSATTDHICNPPSDLTVRLTTDNATYRGRSDFELDYDTLHPLLDSAAFHELTVEDVEFLMCRTEFDGGIVATLARGHALAETTGIPAEAFYAFARSGIPLARNVLYGLSEAEVLAAIERAVDLGAVPASLVASATSIATALAANRVDWMVPATTPESTTLGAILVAASLTVGRPRQFAELYAAHAGTVEEFWTVLRAHADFGHTVVDRIQFTLQVGPLTANHSPLVKLLHAKRDDDAFVHVLELAQYSADDWEDFLAEEVDSAEVGTPSGVPRIDEAAQRANYAQAIARMVEDQFPTAHFTYRLPPASVTADIVAFIRQNPTFSLLRTRVEAFFPDAVGLPADPGDQATLKRDLLKIQRVAAITPRFARTEVGAGMLTAGITSARQIQAMGYAAFKARMSAAGLSAHTDAVYAKADRVASATLHAFMHMRPEMHFPATGVITTPGCGDVDLENLFGSLDYCACKHCQSVYGPAAYFVDLMKFLGDRKIDAVDTQLDRLLERRPELEHILLNCANSDTPLPTIDLVNEILERRARDFLPGMDPPNLSLQTTWGAADLVAHPEHIDTAVYDRLALPADAHFPLSLPFDLSLAEARSYLEALGLSRIGLQDSLEWWNGLGENETFRVDERLGLSRGQGSIIRDEGGGTPDLKALWGFAIVGWIAQINKVETFLLHSGLDLLSLRTLLRSRFLPDVVIAYEKPCTLQNARLGKASEPEDDALGETELRRLQVFLRVRRALGWSIADLDATLAALDLTFADGTLTAELATLARFVRDRRRFPRLPLGEILSWWSPLDRVVCEDGAESYYDQVVRPRTREVSFEALNGTVPLTDVQGSLQGILQVDAAGLTAAYQVTGLDPEVDNLNLVNLSKLYRVASIARAVELSVPELVTLTNYQQTLKEDVPGPFSGVPAAPVRTLLDLAAAVHDSGFTVPALDWVLRHEQPENFGASDADVTRTLTSLITSLQKAHADHLQGLPPLELSQAERVALLLLGVLDGGAIPAAVDFVLELTDPPPVDSDAAEGLRATRLPFITEGDVGFEAFGQVFAGGATVADRIELLSNWFRQKRLERVVIQQLANPLGLEPADVELLLSPLYTGALSSLTADAFFDASSFDSKLDAVLQKGEGFPAIFLKRTNVTPRAILYRGLRKVALVATTFRFSPGLLRWMLAHANDADVTILDLANLPSESPTDPQIYEAYTGWDWLRRMIKLRDDFLRDQTALLSILDLVFAETFNEDNTLTALANAAGWNPDTLAAFELSNPITPVQLKSLTAIEALHQAFRVSASLGADPKTTLSWAKLSTVTPAAAAAIRGSIQGRFGAPTWPGIAQPIRDRLREQQRDALADFIVHRADLEDREDLFGELLTDVGISCCGRTTRLLFATAAVQLFVQRALMGLEADHDVVLDDADEDHWSAMKRYRVWEANRKIFLYPENWVTPELRDDKTPLFKRLEDEIGQSEADATSVEKAYVHYLEGLNEVAKLNIIGMFEEEEAARVHVFARTAGQPSKVYYRCRIDEAYWTPWEPLPFLVDAPGVLPVVAFRRLMLIWPKITIHTDEVESKEITNPPTVFKVDNRQIRLMWAECRDGEWGEVRTSEASMIDVRGPTSPDTGPQGRHPNWDIALTSKSTKDKKLEIRPVRCAPAAKDMKVVSALAIHSHHFEYDARTGGFELVERSRVEEGSYGYPNKFLTPFPSISWHQGFRLPDGLTPDDYLFIPVFFWLGTFPTPIINPHPGFNVLFPRQEHNLLAVRPLVYADDRRVFYIRSKASTSASRPDLPGETTRVASSRHVNLLPYFSFTAGKISASEVASISAIDLALTAQDTAATQQQTAPSGQNDNDASYRLQLLYHPYAALFLEQTRRYGVPGLLDPEVVSNGGGGELVYQANEDPLDADYFAGITGLYESIPSEDVDFTYGGAYSTYNWEAFFHIPMYIAERLMAERRFAEAQRWLGYIFNPIRPPSTVGATDCKHHWRIKPFREAAAKMSIDDLLLLLSYDGDDDNTISRRDDLDAQIEAWRNDPFKPHLIARMRPTAYMRAVVMKYLDNLIAWGDDLFRQDTRESTQEAVQLYILALQILGKRPRRIDGDEHTDQTYAEAEAELDSFGNFLVVLENEVIGFGQKEAWQPLDLPAQANFQAQSPNEFQLTAVVPAVPASLLLGELKANVAKPKPNFNPLPLAATPSGEPKENAKTALYFCIPPNDKLLRYWDTVADRLFKLRNCLNLDGIRRDLALFDPPIDPALLAKAVAQGVDIATAISSLHAPLPHYRFLVHLGIAKEFAGHVSNLGSTLLSALEKRDAEVLAVLRAGHERTLLDFTRKVREQSITEAGDNLEALRLGRAVVEKRIAYFKTRERMSALEKAESVLSVVSAVLDVVGSSLALGGAVFAVALPNFTFGASGIASPVVTGTYGGAQISSGLGMTAQGIGMISGATRTAAGLLGAQASYNRRKEEWEFQQELAETELPQLDKQIMAAELRVAMATVELANHDEQARQSSEALEVMQSKFSNAELYAWMAGEISKVYHHAYQLAVDMAKRTERCYQYELAVDSDFVQFGHWDNRRQGLLAGERLGHDLRRMEAAYYENNRREYELTKRVSLASLDPVALIALRKTGACHFQLPSVIFNLDHASHFQRRIKLVGITIPAVTGPYTNIGVNLTFEGGDIRRKNNSEPEGDGGTAQTQAISVAQEDAGLFEPNLRDERYLPFEGRGLENSKWRIELPPKVRQFDYETISDIILTIRYTAREGGSTLATPVLDGIDTALATLPRAEAAPEHGVGQVRIFSARAEFPEAWRSFVAAGLNGVDAVLPLDLVETRFPHPQLPAGSRTIEMVSIFVRWPTDSTVPAVGEFVGPTLKAPGEDPEVMDAFTVYKSSLPLPDGAGYNYLWLSTVLYGGGKALGAWVFTVPDGWAAEVAPEDVYIVVQHKVS